MHASREGIAATHSVMSITNMKIDVKCPQCRETALSKLRKVTIPGMSITCTSCKAKLAINSIFSITNILSLVIGFALIKLFPGTVLFWLGGLVAVAGSTYHLAVVPLKVINKGPNHEQYHS